MDMLEYSKMILSKMRFDEELLKKELRKAFQFIKHEEEPFLLEWCRKELGEKYELIALKNIMAQEKPSPN